LRISTIIKRQSDKEEREYMKSSKNGIERIILDLVITLIEDDKKDPLVNAEPLSEDDAFDIAIEMLQESLDYHTLKECKKTIGSTDY